MTGALPKELAHITTEDGTIVVKILRELIFYKVDFTIQEHDALIGLYRRYLPEGRDQRFRIPELPSWSPVSRPRLTMSARAVKGKPLAEFEAVRQRIAERRWFFSKLWDGREIEDDDGSWSLELHRQHYEEAGWHGFIRMLFPVELPDETHIAIAREVIETVSFISGHGGYVFAYASDRKTPAFDRIFALARRFRGMDIEDLPVTLPHMRNALKPPCWLNMVGRDEGPGADLWPQLHGLQAEGGVEVIVGRHGFLARLSKRPEPLDVNRQGLVPPGYLSYGAAIEPERLRDIDMLSGRRFSDDRGATEEWLRRFSPAAAP